MIRLGYLCILNQKLLNMEAMTATERYEHDWDLYLKELARKPCLSLTSFLKSRHTNINGMKKWMERQHLSVREAKKAVKASTKGGSCVSSPGTASSALFSPVSITPSSQASSNEEDCLSGISLTFPDGTVVSIKRGSARAVMSFLKLYQK